jgi:hypothetical protein
MILSGERFSVHHYDAKVMNGATAGRNVDFWSDVVIRQGRLIVKPEYFERIRLVIGGIHVARAPSCIPASPEISYQGYPYYLAEQIEQTTENCRHLLSNEPCS